MRVLPFSRLWKRVGAGRTSFLNLPVEVQVEILCHLDPASLVACRLTCRSLSTLFEESMAVQYAYRLGISAMTDVGSPEGVSLRDRYAAIVRYQRASKRILFPARIQSPGQDSFFLAQSNGVFVYAFNDSGSVALKLHRPGSARTGLPELTFLCVKWKSFMEPRSFSAARFAVDLSEDLLVITRPSDDKTEYLHHFISISGDCYRHPVAASSTLRAPRSTQQSHAITYPRGDVPLDILSDLVAWGHLQAVQDEDYSDLPQTTVVQITNWKTGTVVWRYQSHEISSYHLIDRHHILITQHDGIHVFAFDPDRSGPAPPVYTKPQAQLLHLRLPAFEPAAQRAGLFKSVLNIPRSHPDDRPLFRPDPSHSLLAICMDNFALNCRPDRFQKSGVLFLVSLETIRAYLARRLKTGWARFGRSLVLRWDDWGPMGARVVTTDDINLFDLSIATLGSRCVLTIARSAPLVHVVVIDAHPWAQHHGRGLTRHPISLRGVYHTSKLVDSSYLHHIDTLGPYERLWKTWKQKVMILQGTFPCHMAQCLVQVRWPDYSRSHTVLTGEEVVVVRTRRIRSG
ncbi:hypothetical protein L226DRAFT_614584 [Lentinus tigrinus ALCF2SS1-7]|uniref:F-box domain-containing protein n=1 Tax=Lentinus tigrinus ALCF2SS1-6 TaxID=1328759 RepID=A0A5C2RSX5_9APHY|nr:hypothetical protein L227DRAFT_658330 [Lentinus tigrinus ALCF2SS1-6]RPD72685.1 hypothetical protein L226DRAFT_614584 [Lentinus tigrinus ALCF2SS1-7]